jgi:AAA lid domain
MCRSRAGDRACFCLVTDAFAEQTIDLVGVSPDGSTVLIYLVQSTAWTGSDAQVRSLQAKIQNYVGFALDGQLVRTYPKVHGLPWSIVVDCQTGPPDTRSAEVLAHAATAISNALERMRLRQANRLVAAGGEMSRDDLMTLTEDDVRQSRLFDPVRSEEEPEGG